MALNAYPWNWVPVVDQEADQLAGYVFGVDAFDHLGLQADVDGKCESLTSDAQLPLKKWAYVVGTFEAAQGLSIYLDGKRVGSLATHGSMAPAWGIDILIGRVRQATPPAEWIHPKYAVWYSLCRKGASGRGPALDSDAFRTAGSGPVRRLLLDAGIRRYVGHAAPHRAGF